MRDEKGMVLLLVLVVVALLSAVLIEFSFSTLVDLRLTETYRDSTRAWYIAKGGIQAGRMIRKMDTNGYDHPSEVWGVGIPSYPVKENGFVSITIEDLGGKLNLNDLVTQGVNVNPDMRNALERLFEILGQEHPDEFPARPRDMVAALIDWIDTDDQTHQSTGEGAESAYYQRQQTPYRAKNGPLDTLDELLLVRDFTPQTLRLLEPFVTAHPVQGAAVNINTAPAEVLRALHPDVDQASVERLLQARESEPFRTLSELGQLLGVQSPAYSGLASMQWVKIAVRSPAFRIVSRAGVGDGARTATALVNATGDTVYYLKVD